MGIFLIGCLLSIGLVVAPAHGQFNDGLDGWGNLGPTYQPPAYQHPSYADPYTPYTPPLALDDPWERDRQHQRSIDDTLDRFGMGHRDRMEGMMEERLWTDQMRGNRCSGNWGVQTWNECE